MDNQKSKRWHSPGLETRGLRPDPFFRGELSRYINADLDRELRKEINIQLIWGNSWPGYFENGNPHGEPRPGLPGVLKGFEELFVNNYQKDD